MAIESHPGGVAAPPREPESVASEREGPIDPRRGSEPAIKVEHAGKQYGTTWVVEDLTFNVDQGRIFGLFGPSGSGKTTTLRLLLGLVGLTAGKLWVLGEQPRRFRARTRAKIGYMPQLFVLYPEMSVLENINLVASLYGMGWLKRRKPIREILEFVELWEHRTKVAGDLSGGMKRRLELATTLVHNPDLLIMDEPTAGIDPILRAKFWDHFRALRDQGRTIIVTSQYVTEAEYCDEILVLAKGRMVEQGTPAEVRDKAMGGEIVEVVAEGLNRRLAEELRGSIEGFKGYNLKSYDHLELTVEQAAATIPQVLSALQERKIEVQQVQEYRPNFDEVFVRLMENSGHDTVE